MSAERPQIIGDCYGLDTVSDPVRLGPGDLQLAHNVTISERKRIDRADGYSLVKGITTPHSLFCDKGPALVAGGTSLYHLASDHSTRGVRSVMSGARISYAEYGDEIYYGNGSEIGIFRDGASYVWASTHAAYNGPPTTRQFVQEIPRFTKLAVHHGRMFGVVGNSLFQSELGDFGLWDVSAVFSLAKDINLVASLAGGLLIGDSLGVWFLAGSNLENFSPTQVLHYPAIEWSEATTKAELSEIGMGDRGQYGVLFNTTRGPCLCGPQGSTTNLVEHRIIYPGSAASGATVLRGHDLIAAMDTGICSQTAMKVGDPGSKATTYRGSFSFNSFCRFGGQYLACGQAGVYLLGGETFDGVIINSEFEPATSEMGYHGPKSVRFFFVGFEATGRLRFTPYADEVVGVAKELSPRKTGQQTIRDTFNHNTRGRYWKFNIQNVAGCDFSIDSMIVTPIFLSTGRSNY